MACIHQHKLNTLATIATVVCRFRFPCRILFASSSLQHSVERSTYSVDNKTPPREKQQEAPNPEEAWVCGSYRTAADCCAPKGLGQIVLASRRRSPPAGLWEEVMTSSSSLCRRYGSVHLWANQSRTLERMPPRQMVRNSERGTKWCWSEECLLPCPLYHPTMHKAGLLSTAHSIFANFIKKTSAIAHDMIIGVNWNWRRLHGENKLEQLLQYTYKR